MKQFILTVLGASTANILSFLFYQGFVKSKIGKNIRQEITRWFNQLWNLFKRKKNV